MKHLPDLLTLLYRRPLFHMYVHLSICLSTFMSKFDIYVKVSILINYKTQQPSNLAWNTSLTSRLYDIGAHFSIRLSVRPSVCPSVNSSVMSKFDIYVKVSILINYKTKQPSNLVWNISLTSWLCDIDARFAICLFVRPSVCLLQQPSYLAWHISLTSWLGRYVDPVTLTYILRSIDFDTIYLDVPDLLNYKAYNYQTLHSASPRCTDLAGTLTRWPWPIFCAPVTLTYFVGYLFNYKAYNHQTLKSASSQRTDLADTLTWWPWPIFWLQWLWHNLRQRSRSPQV